MCSHWVLIKQQQLRAGNCQRLRKFRNFRVDLSMRYGSVILLITLFGFWNVGAQKVTPAAPTSSYIFHHIDYSDGLLNNNVKSITQDGRGFMWIGSTKGLQRYDGHRFVNYPDTAANLDENIVSRVYADNANNCLLYLNNKGLMQWQWFQNKLIVAESKKNFNSYAEKYTDWTGRTWAISRSRICKYDKTGKIISAGFSYMPDTVSFGFTTFAKETIDDSMWIADGNEGFLVFDPATKKIYSSQHNDIHHPLLEQWLNAEKKYQPLGPGIIYRDGRGNIWKSTWGEFFFRYNCSTKELNIYRLTDIVKAHKAKFTGRVIEIMEDNHGIVWVATAGAGLLRYDPQTEKFSVIQYEQKNRLGIQYHTDVNCLFQDREENIWVGTDRGICIFNPYRQNFTALQAKQYEQADPSASKYLNAVIETNKGDILVGTWGNGITVYDKNRNFKKTMEFKDIVDKNLVWSFVQNDNGTVWAGCQHGWLHIINPDNYSVETINPPELEQSTVRRMEKDRNGNILLGLHNGKVAIWNKSTREFYSFNDSLQKITGYPVTAIFTDTDQNYWVSTWDGIKQFDFTKRIFIDTYLPAKTDSKTIVSLKYTGIEEYNDSILIVGNQLGGLIFFNKHTKSFSQLPVSDEPAKNTVYAVKKDSAGNIWFATEYDIYKYNPLSKKMIACNIEKGLITASFDEQSQFYSTHTGLWLIKTGAELLQFYPGDMAEREHEQHPVAITGLNVLGKPVFIDSLLHADKPLKLRYGQNFITIEFSALDFSSMQRIKYYYQLTGINSDWIDAGANNVATYTSLPPGEYIFRVKTVSINEKITSFTIIIATPFWQRWWFIALLIFIAASFVYLFYRYRLNQILKLQKVRNRIASDLHDEIGSTLTNISILSNLSKSNLSNTPKAEDFLQRISAEVSSSSQALDDIIWSVNTSHDTLEETVARMRRYAAELFDAAGISYELYLDNTFEKTKLAMEQRRDIYLLYKEAVNNISKHAQAKQVNIKIDIAHSQLRMLIADDGKGFETGKENNRHGLQSMKQRVEKWKGKITIESGSGKGTSIRIQLPV